MGGKLLQNLIWYSMQTLIDGFKMMWLKDSVIKNPLSYLILIYYCISLFPVYQYMPKSFNMVELMVCTDCLHLSR